MVKIENTMKYLNTKGHVKRLARMESVLCLRNLNVIVDVKCKENESKGHMIHEACCSSGVLGLTPIRSLSIDDDHELTS